MEDNKEGETKLNFKVMLNKFLLLCKKEKDLEAPKFTLPRVPPQIIPAEVLKTSYTYDPSNKLAEVYGIRVLNESELSTFEEHLLKSQLTDEYLFSAIKEILEEAEVLEDLIQTDFSEEKCNASIPEHKLSIWLLQKIKRLGFNPEEFLDKVKDLQRKKAGSSFDQMSDDHELLPRILLEATSEKQKGKNDLSVTSRVKSEKLSGSLLSSTDVGRTVKVESTNHSSARNQKLVIHKSDLSNVFDNPKGRNSKVKENSSYLIDSESSLTTTSKELQDPSNPSTTSSDSSANKRIDSLLKYPYILDNYGNRLDNYVSNHAESVSDLIKRLGGKFTGNANKPKIETESLKDTKENLKLQFGKNDINDKTLFKGGGIHDELILKYEKDEESNRNKGKDDKCNKSSHPNRYQYEKSSKVNPIGNKQAHKHIGREICKCRKGMRNKQFERGECYCKGYKIIDKSNESMLMEMIKSDSEGKKKIKRSIVGGHDLEAILPDSLIETRIYSFLCKERWEERVTRKNYPITANIDNLCMNAIIKAIKKNIIDNITKKKQKTAKESNLPTDILPPQKKNLLLKGQLSFKDLDFSNFVNFHDFLRRTMKLHSFKKVLNVSKIPKENKKRRAFLIKKLKEAVEELDATRIAEDWDDRSLLSDLWDEELQELNCDFDLINEKSITKTSDNQSYNHQNSLSLKTFMLDFSGAKESREILTGNTEVQNKNNNINKEEIQLAYIQDDNFFKEEDLYWIPYDWARDYEFYPRPPSGLSLGSLTTSYGSIMTFPDEGNPGWKQDFSDTSLSESIQDLQEEVKAEMDDDENNFDDKIWKIPIPERIESEESSVSADSEEGKKWKPYISIEEEAKEDVGKEEDEKGLDQADLDYVYAIIKNLEGIYENYDYFDSRCRTVPLQVLKSIHNLLILKKEDKYLVKCALKLFKGEDLRILYKVGWDVMPFLEPIVKLLDSLHHPNFILSDVFFALPEQQAEQKADKDVMALKAERCSSEESLITDVRNLGKDNRMRKKRMKFQLKLMKQDDIMDCKKKMKEREKSVSPTRRVKKVKKEKFLTKTKEQQPTLVPKKKMNKHERFMFSRNYENEKFSESEDNVSDSESEISITDKLKMNIMKDIATEFSPKDAEDFLGFLERPKRKTKDKNELQFDGLRKNKHCNLKFDGGGKKVNEAVAYEALPMNPLKGEYQKAKNVSDMAHEVKDEDIGKIIPKIPYPFGSRVSRSLTPIKKEKPKKGPIMKTRDQHEHILEIKQSKEEVYPKSENLEKFLYKILSLSNPEKAVKYLKNKAPDACETDVYIDSYYGVLTDSDFGRPFKKLLKDNLEKEKKHLDQDIHQVYYSWEPVKERWPVIPGTNYPIFEPLLDDLRLNEDAWKYSLPPLDYRKCGLTIQALDDILWRKLKQAVLAEELLDIKQQLWEKRKFEEKENRLLYRAKHGYMQGGRSGLTIYPMLVPPWHYQIERWPQEVRSTPGRELAQIESVFSLESRLKAKKKTKEKPRKIKERFIGLRSLQKGFQQLEDKTRSLSTQQIYCLFCTFPVNPYAYYTTGRHSICRECFLKERVSQKYYMEERKAHNVKAVRPVKTVNLNTKGGTTNRKSKVAYIHLFNINNRNKLYNNHIVNNFYLGGLIPRQSLCNAANDYMIYKRFEDFRVTKATDIESKLLAEINKHSLKSQKLKKAESTPNDTWKPGNNLKLWRNLYMKTGK